MNPKSALDTIVEHASPYITLSYVLDDEGNLLAHFNFHPQIDEITIELNVMTNHLKEIQLTPEDVREFAKKLYEFADAAEEIVDRYVMTNTEHVSK